MTEATVSARLEVNDPTCEVVVLQATDAETYISKKFGKIRAVQATSNDSTGTGTAICAPFSGGTVTIKWAGITDKDCTLTIYGSK